MSSNDKTPTKAPPSTKDLSCAHCGAGKGEVRRLIGGKDNFCICSNCLEQFFSFMTMLEKEHAVGAKNGIPKPKDIIHNLDKWVIGQEEAKRSLAVAFYQHYRRREAGGESEGVKLQKSNVLIYGPSGTGKTELIRAICKYIGVPMYVGDATRLTAAGFVGDDVETLLQGLLADASGDLKRAAWGVVVLDEVDKIRKTSGRLPSGQRDVGGEAVQQGLLKIIEGGDVTFARQGKQGEMVTLNTENILFVFLGSFAGIEDIVAARVNKGQRVGFGGAPKQEVKRDAPLEADQEDFLEFGMIPEFLGRVPVRTKTIPLTVEQIARILTEPQNAILKQKKAIFKMDGTNLEFTVGAIQSIAAQAHKDPTGVRALAKIVDRILEPHALANPSDPVHTLRFEEASVAPGGSTPPILIPFLSEGSA